MTFCQTVVRAWWKCRQTAPAAQRRWCTVSSASAEHGTAQRRPCAWPGPVEQRPKTWSRQRCWRDGTFVPTPRAFQRRALGHVTPSAERRSTRPATHIHYSTHSSLWNWSFTAAGLRIWISLPLHLRDSQLTILEFRRLLKTHQFCWVTRPLVTAVFRAPYKCWWQAASQVGHTANDGGATTLAIDCWATEHSLCKAPWSGTPCRTTSAHSRTMNPLDSVWKPGFSLATSVLIIIMI